MTKDDIILMAREAGIRVASAHDTIDPKNVYPHELERFANLVATAEREACAKVCEGNDASWPDDEWNNACHACADDIRARGEK